MSNVERIPSKPEITRISGHAIENVMTRWGLGLVDAGEFVRDRYNSATELEDPLSRKKKHRDRRVFKSGNATIIGKLNNDGLDVTTVIRTDQIDRKAVRVSGLLRRKI